MHSSLTASNLCTAIMSIVPKSASVAFGLWLSTRYGLLRNRDGLFVHCNRLELTAGGDTAGRTLNCVESERPPLYAIAGLPGNGQLLVRYPTPRSLKPPLPTGVLQSVIAVASRFSYYILLKNSDSKYNSEHCTMRINDVA